MRAVSLTYRLLFDFLRKQQPADAGAALVLAPARAYLEAHWNQTVTLSDLARLCHLSVSYFRHLFLRFYGICPLRYRDSLRLLHARDYLLTETWPIAEIARRCGFHDANYFSRFFRQRMGISPSDYRTAGQFA